MTKIQIAAVGDILMWRRQIQSARRPGGQFEFDGMFREVASHLDATDLVIGNLETTLSGKETVYQQTNPKNGYPMFNCPDELAVALKRAGIDVLTTANNHCLDRGVTGLRRTLDVLDRHGLGHTGTFRTPAEARRPLIRNVSGIKVGLLSYTYGTNALTVPPGEGYTVNRINPARIVRDISRIRPQVDVLLVALHFGTEFCRYPNERQKELVALCFRHGADVVFGAHPHVLQPVALKASKDAQGVIKTRLAAYSLGNFVSDRMFHSLHADSGVILKFNVEKFPDQAARVVHVETIPTWVHRYTEKGRLHFRVLPVRRFLKQPDSRLSAQDRKTLQTVWDTTTKHVRF